MAGVVPPRPTYKPSDGFNQFFAGIEGRFCKEAEIRLYACRVIGGDQGKALAALIEELTGAQVNGFADYCDVGGKNDNYIVKPAKDPKPDMFDKPGTKPQPTPQQEDEAKLPGYWWELQNDVGQLWNWLLGY